MQNIEGELESLLGKWLWESHSYPVDQKQSELTQDFLLPNQEVIARDLLAMRRVVDAKIKKALRKEKNRPAEYYENNPSIVNPAAYPKGYCHEIQAEMWNNILDNFHNPALPGMRALGKFQKKGGVMKKISGIQHGLFFQNAIQAGSLWVDVANDTVDLDKPPVELSPLAESGFQNIDNLEICGNVLESYLRQEVFPNTFFPHIAPYFPVVTIDFDGTINLLPLGPSVTALNLFSDFQLAEDFIFTSRFSAAELPAEYHCLIERTFSQGSWPEAIFCKGGAMREVLADIFANLRGHKIEKNLRSLTRGAHVTVDRFNALKLKPKKKLVERLKRDMIY